jgi:hypothetical protein
MSDIVLSAAEEFGEFCRELKIEESIFGNSHKEAGDDGTVGESVDMVIMALALYYARHAKVTGCPPPGLDQWSIPTKEILDRMTVKLDKWENNQLREEERKNG